MIVVEKCEGRAIVTSSPQFAAHGMTYRSAVELPLQGRATVRACGNLAANSTIFELNWSKQLGGDGDE
jgi:hypothetical protein